MLHFYNRGGWPAHVPERGWSYAKAKRQDPTQWNASFRHDFVVLPLHIWWNSRGWNPEARTEPSMSALIQLRQAIGRRCVSLFLAAWLSVVAAPCWGATFADPPVPPQADEVLLISTRKLGTTCDANRLDRELACWRLTFDAAGQPTWLTHDWHNLQCPMNAQRQTVIYVHGNRVSEGSDAAEGMAVYQSLVGARKNGQPLRYIIWSWPSAQIPGLIKDYQVKAVRTNPVAWQLAWFLDQLPTETPIAMMGYSYGARAVSGAAHMLGGGSLGTLKLAERQHPNRPPIRVALMAAAFDADWMLPGEVHQKAITQIERMVVITNKQDPAMRFFKLSTKNSRVDALGLAGIPHIEKLGAAAKRIQHIDVTHEVGRSHVIYDYLADSPKMNRMWAQMIDNDARPMQDLAIPAYAHLRPESTRR